jgi:zinc/manganese transport system ATP-binding protein
VSSLIDERRRRARTVVVFVTHDVNPVLPYVDRVLYLVEGRWAVGAADEVLTSARLSELYGADVEVLDIRGRVVVIGGGEVHMAEPHTHHHQHHV